MNFGTWRMLANNIMPLGLAVVLCIAIAQAYGIDQNWDQLHYHFYSPLGLSGSRMHEEFMPGGAQSYQNPQVYLLFHWLVVSDLHPRVVASCLASIHALNAYLIYLISVEVFKAESCRIRTLYGVYCLLLCVFSTLFLMLLATSFADLIVSIPILAAWLLVAKSSNSSSKRSAPLIGALLGLALTLKLSSVFLVSATVISLLVLQDIGRTIRMLVALTLVFLVLNAHWYFTLFVNFQNPIFPLANNIFASPYWPTAGMSHTRFSPTSILSTLSLPIEMLQPRRNIYVETIAVDWRPFFLLVLSLAVVVKWLWSRASGAVADIRVSKVEISLCVITVLSLAIWLTASGNGRYVVALSMFLVIPTVWLANLLLTSVMRWLVLATLLLLQLHACFVVGGYRWSGEPWRDRWFDVTFPAGLIKETVLLISVDAQSSSFVLPMLGARARSVSLAYPPQIGPSSESGKRVQRIVAAHSNIWMIVELPDLKAPGVDEWTKIYSEWLTQRERSLLPFGLKLAGNTCSVVSPQKTFRGQAVVGRDSASMGRNATMVCQLMKVRPVSFYSANAEAVFDALEGKYPKILPPGTATTRSLSDSVFARSYLSTDAVVVILENGEISMVSGHGLPFARIGNVSDYGFEDVRIKSSGTVDWTK
jgi:hypothetical protein